MPVALKRRRDKRRERNRHDDLDRLLEGPPSPNSEVLLVLEHPRKIEEEHEDEEDRWPDPTMVHFLSFVLFGPKRMWSM